MPSDLELPSPSIPHDPRKDVLSDEDLLDLIFGFIQADIDRSAPQNSDSSTGYKPRRQLLNLALTSKTFVEPALNAPWHSLPTLVPLIRLIRGKTILDETYCLRSAPAPDNWAQLLAYGNRVRVLTFNGSPALSPPHKVSPFLYQVVSLQSRLPRVKEIVLVSTTSTLVKVEVVNVTDAPRDVQFIHHLLAALCRTSPSLEYLSIYGKGKGSISLSGSPVIASSLTRLAHLHIVIHDVLDNSNDLRALANLEHLHCLTLHVGNPQPANHQQIPIAMITTPYPVLRRLEFVGTASNIRRSLSMISLSSIQNLVLKFHQQKDDGHHWNESFEHVVSGNKGDLTDLEVFSRRFILTSQYFEAILGIKSLTRLTLDVTAVSATNEFIQAIATSLPNLTSLILPPVPGETNPDMGCLLSLANGCPNLVKLCICLHLGKGMGGKIPVESYPKHRLRSLSISSVGGDTAKIGVPEGLATARFLNSIFPHLQDLLTHRNSDGEGSGKAETMSDIAMLINVLREANVATTV